MDNQNNVICYVTPAPGVNMQYYIGRRVGITGERGYDTNARAQHLMAQHVTPLENGGTTSSRRVPSALQRLARRLHLVPCRLCNCRQSSHPDHPGGLNRGPPGWI